MGRVLRASDGRMQASRVGGRPKRPRGALFLLLSRSSPSQGLKQGSRVPPPRARLSPLPPLLSMRALPMEATSSMKMIEGACSLAGAARSMVVGGGGVVVVVVVERSDGVVQSTGRALQR